MNRNILSLYPLQISLRKSARMNLLLSCQVLWAVVGALVPISALAQTAQPAYEVLRADILINADLWDVKPRILAAGLGFTDIIGVPDISTADLGLSETQVKRAGGAWTTPSCATAETGLYAYTSAASPESIEALYGDAVYFSDGLPVEFSWPVLPSSIDPKTFAFTLNNGQVVYPQVASIWPNFEYNERSTVVLFGYFGNRMSDLEEGAIYPVSLEIVGSSNPLTLVGPGGVLFDATGLSIDMPGSPYSSSEAVPYQRKGPRLVAAKISRFNAIGDTGPVIFRNGLLPNHGSALYGDRAQFRLRVLTTGGMTFDGVRGLHPDEFEKFFRIVATDNDGDSVYLDTVGKEYVFRDGSVIKIEGLADLGAHESSYDDCYQEDKDNQIDVILSGDAKAARKIIAFEIPSVGDYLPLYNPGGPGPWPVPNVRYSDPSPPIRIDVMQALENPMTVTYISDKSGPPPALRKRLEERSRNNERSLEPAWPYKRNKQ